MVRSNQGGSVLSFLIIGGALVVLLVGGVYFARTHANDTIAQATSDQKQSHKSDETTAPKPNEEEAKPKPEATKPEVSTPKPQPAPVTPRPAQLPQTGPAETFMAMLAIGLLTGTSVAYYRSRQHRLTL